MSLATGAWAYSNGDQTLFAMSAPLKDSLAQFKWEQMVFLGNPECVCDLQATDFLAVANGFGMAGSLINHPAHSVEFSARHWLSTDRYLSKPWSM
jgi:hypothetical protein